MIFDNLGGINDMVVSEGMCGLDLFEYIVYYLQNFFILYQMLIFDIYVWNFDMLFWLIVCGIVMIVLLCLVVCKVMLGVLGCFQCVIEMFVEMVEDQLKVIVYGNCIFIVLFVFMVFVWVVLMNFFDFFLVDLLGCVIGLFGLLDVIFYYCIVLMVDLNGMFGIVFGVFVLMIYYSIKIKGVGGFVYELLLVLFGVYLLLWILNFVFNIVEYFVKIVLFGMWLFGNMYVGELLFLLIVLFGSMWSFGGDVMFFGFVGYVIVGSVWVIFYILIVLLQVFIFMMLMLVYFGQVYDKY